MPLRHFLFCAPDVDLYSIGMTHARIQQLIRAGVCGGIYAPTITVDNICYPSPILRPKIFDDDNETEINFPRMGMTSLASAKGIAKTLIESSEERGFDYTYAWVQVRQPLYQALLSSIHAVWIAAILSLIAFVGMFFHVKVAFCVVSAAGLASQVIAGLLLIISSVDDLLFFDESTWSVSSRAFRIRMQKFVGLFTLSLAIAALAFFLTTFFVLTCTRRKFSFTLDMIHVVNRRIWKTPCLLPVIVWFLIIRLGVYALGAIQVVAIFSAATKARAVNCTSSDSTPVRDVNFSNPQRLNSDLDSSVATMIV
ncbi:unnamed protein product [Notodromas monacha]|uniref:Uncharacterized protein n=1 Tax=Notodromas monacha TaxID=399045 RepID=A0A7R9C3G4_9CRUS|nr:unnamed protein product [Notodromas monacha]CAG0925477.1 unnamed protein product [Notodromas monacha]